MSDGLIAYVAVSPHGTLIPSTIRPDADDAWRTLRAAISEPDTLIEKGWRLCRLNCLTVGFVE